MSDAFIIENNTLYVSGVLQLKRAAALLAQLAKLKVNNNIQRVDFAGTTDCDTTGVLLMLRLQRSGGAELQFINVPLRLRALIKLSNLLSRFNLQ